MPCAGRVLVWLRGHFFVCRFRFLLLPVAPRRNCWFACSCEEVGDLTGCYVGKRPISWCLGAVCYCSLGKATWTLKSLYGNEGATRIFLLSPVLQMILQIFLVHVTDRMLGQNKACFSTSQGEGAFGLISSPASGTQGWCAQ